MGVIICVGNEITQKAHIWWVLGTKASHIPILESNFLPLSFLSLEADGLMGTVHGFRLQDTKSLGYSKALSSSGTRNAAQTVEYRPRMWDILWFSL